MWKKYLLLAVFAALVANQVAAQDKTTDLAIVVAKSSTLDNLTSEELTKIFLEEKPKDPDGHKYVVIMRETGSPEFNAALASIYKYDAGQYDTYFLRAVFAGKAAAKPQQLNGSANVRAYVAATPGAISYARASEVDDALKTIKIDGKAPGDAGYPLKIK